MDHWHTIEEVRLEAIVCCRCPLCYTRTHVVFGTGPAPARLMIVGEGPGADEDFAGTPFVGKSGKTLDKMLSDAGLTREEIWVTNIVRCRLASLTERGLQNRAPRPEEIRACTLWMDQEFRFVQPEVVLCLGLIPAQALIGRSLKLAEGRGKWHEGRNGIPTTVTYHPAMRYMGREKKPIVEAQMAEDFRMVAARLQPHPIRPICPISLIQSRRRSW